MQNIKEPNKRTLKKNKPSIKQPRNTELYKQGELLVNAVCLELLDIKHMSNDTVFSSTFCKITRENGLSSALAYMKKCRTATYIAFSNSETEPPVGIRLTWDGYPTFLQEWIPLLRKGNKNSFRVVISKLFLGRLYTSVGELVTDSITRPYSGMSVNDVISRENIKSFLRMQLVTLPMDITETKFFVRSSSGPQGPAMTSIIDEGKALGDELLKDINLFLTTEMKEVLTDIRSPTCFNEPSLAAHVKKSMSSVVRRITVVDDKEGKNRVIAIFDYWSQLVLRPLHRSLIRVVDNLWNDCTFNQTKYCDDFAINGGPYYSFDLKEASDRIPAELSLNILKELLQDDEKSEAYFRILRDQPFSTKTGKIVRYAVGQPMGAYSSWPLLAITHHLIIYQAMVKSKAGQNDYMILGDDLVIRGHAFAQEYRFLVKSLGIEISEAKTLISNSSFEFAKRFYHNGENCSPIPIGQLKHAMGSYWDIVGFMRQCETRGYDFSSSILRRNLTNIIFAKYPSRKREWYNRKIEKYYWSPDCFTTDWDNELLYRIEKWIPKDKFNFGCNANENFVRQYVLELYINITMTHIHENIVGQVQSYNKFAKNPFYSEWKESTGKYHPMISIMHSCVKDLQDIEYNVSSNPLVETSNYYRMRVRIDDFSSIPADITKILSASRHSQMLRVRSLFNSKLEKLILSLEVKRYIEMGKENIPEPVAIDVTTI